MRESAVTTHIPPSATQHTHKYSRYLDKKHWKENLRIWYIKLKNSGRLATILSVPFKVNFTKIEKTAIKVITIVRKKNAPILSGVKLQNLTYDWQIWQSFGWRRIHIQRGRMLEIVAYQLKYLDTQRRTILISGFRDN